MTEELKIDEIGVEEEVVEEASKPQESASDYSDPSDFGIAIDKHAGYFDANNVKFLVYGEAGSGKTVFASTWNRPIFLDIDKGLASVTKKVHKVEINSIDDIEDAVRYLRGANHPFRTVVVDSINELQYIQMRNIIEKYPTIRRAYSDLPSLSDYGKLIDTFEKIVRQIKSLQMNVVFIANVAPQIYETDTIQIQLVGKQMPRTMTRMVDVVGYLYRVEGGDTDAGKTRVMVFDAANYTSKDRSGVLPTTMENPTYGKLHEYWKTRIEE
jgi:hypothetical protein